MSVNGRFCLSKLFQPITAISKTANLTRQDVTSKSQRLMLELGIIHQANPGCFHLLPLGLKSLNKLIKIVDEEMQSIGGQKVMLPVLTNSKLWKTSGRLQTMGPELIKLQDRHQHEYILSPTHEEAASDVLAAVYPISYKHFPLLLYQITSKFRDEMKPRFGLIRGREFIMKDMYSFDLDCESAKETYGKVCESYDNIFRKIGVDYVKVLGTSGVMGGSLSHEYHFKADIGDDKILTCTNCGYTANVELSGEQKCPNCETTSHISVQHSIEVGHTFFLGDKYSKPLKANYLSKHSKPETLQMGSYGLGLTRILAASVEVLSTEQEMRWPDILAPFNVVILPPKKGSKEDLQTENIADKLYTSLEDNLPYLKNYVLLDDRVSLTIGRRFLDANRTGHRFIIVINKKCIETPALFEMNDIKNNLRVYLSENDLFKYIKENTQF